MKRVCGVGVLLVLFGTMAYAQEGETWETQEPVWDVTTIRILPNMEEQYLNNLRKTWVGSMEMAKKEGLITDYKILSSVVSNAEGYNLMLIIHYPNLAALDATATLREKWMKLDKELEKVVPKSQAETITSTVYPKVRDIENEKLLREIKFLNK